MASKLESKCSQFLCYIIILLTSYIIRFSGGFFYFDSNNIGSSRLYSVDQCTCSIIWDLKYKIYKSFLLKAWSWNSVKLTSRATKRLGFLWLSPHSLMWSFLKHVTRPSLLSRNTVVCISPIRQSSAEWKHFLCCRGNSAWGRSLLHSLIGKKRFLKDDIKS